MSIALPCSAPGFEAGYLRLEVLHLLLQLRSKVGIPGGCDCVFEIHGVEHVVPAKLRSIVLRAHLILHLLVKILLASR